jgi:acyl-homoserine lactone acylase PvdQ
MAALACLAAAAPASARDYSGTALNIVPSGQWGGLPIPANADQQARMYDALTPLFDNVTDTDLQRTFKSAKLGDAPGPTRTESVPRKGVRIVRDAFNVPHIRGRNHDDVTWAMGWVLQQDRGLLLAQGRGPGRLAALDAPGIRAFDLVVKLTPFTPSRQADRIIARHQVRNLRRAGKQGRAVLHDIDMFVAGINARLRREKSDARPFNRVDIFGFIALAGELFGRGGGDEARRSAFYDGLRDRLGAPTAQAVFDDLSSRNDPDRPNTMTRASNTMGGLGTPGAGNAIVDHGSYQPVRFGSASARAVEQLPSHASNFLMLGRERSETGHPLFVAGPQIGYYYPGLTLEADISWPGHQMRGIYSPAHPGVIFIGRGEDFAYSLTSAGNDTADQFVERLCGGSDTRYTYKGRCRTMGRVNAGRVGNQNVVYRTTVHGPVTGYATVDGRRVAISRRRASAGRDALWMLPFRDATFGRIRSAEDLFRAANKQPYTFNVAYADDRDIAVFSAGRLPKRDRRVDQRLPTWGTGQYEWRGYMPLRAHPRQKNPSTGALINWNNRPAPGFASADDDWDHGPLHRVRMLDAGIDRRQTHSLSSVTSAMNAAATMDIRSFGLTPLLAQILAGGPPPSERAARMLGLLVDWNATGSSRLDRDEDGVMDSGAAPAIWDELYPRLVTAVMGGVLGDQLEEFRTLVGRNNNPSSGFTGGAINHVHKDLSAIAGRPLKAPYRTRYCGGGDPNVCRDALWKALDETGAALEQRQGTADPAAWKADANAERIGFAPGVLPLKIRYTNRPSGIQQVITFTGHRPRR